MIPTNKLPQSSHTITTHHEIQLALEINSTLNTAGAGTSDHILHHSEQHSVSNFIHPETQTDPTHFTSTSTQTEVLMQTHKSIYFSALSESDFIYYTGLNSERFVFLFEILNLKPTQYDKYMSRKYQLILTLIKYRQNLQFQLIGKLYGVSRKIVRNIFVLLQLLLI